MESARISDEPVSILFNTSVVAKRDVWSIDLIKILDLLMDILAKTGHTDLKVAGMAALSSSLIYHMKVESIFALQRAVAEKRPIPQRVDVDIDIIDMPYRHESTFPVSLDDLLEMLQDLIGMMANPRSHRKAMIEPVESPNFDEYFVKVEDFIAKYQDLIMSKIERLGSGTLHEIIQDLDSIDSIRCFFAILFLARDQRVDLEQDGDDIKIIMVKDDALGTES